jgi:hypothetical protein
MPPVIQEDDFDLVMKSTQTDRVVSIVIARGFLEQVIRMGFKKPEMRRLSDLLQ